MFGEEDKECMGMKIKRWKCKRTSSFVTRVHYWSNTDKATDMREALVRQLSGNGSDGHDGDTMRTSRCSRSRVGVCAKAKNRRRAPERHSSPAVRDQVSHMIGRMAD